MPFRILERCEGFIKLYDGCARINEDSIILDVLYQKNSWGI
jgi:hypothetical protein